MSSGAKNKTGKLDLSNFEKRLLSLSESNIINSDCEFIVGNEKSIVKGHKIFFAAASEVFQAMFFGELKEENAVNIPDLDPEGFQSMKFFIYTGKVNFTSVLNALSTFTAARKYLISDLSNECSKYIIKDALSPLEVLEFYEYCQVHQIPEFEELCSGIIQDKTDKVLESDFFYFAKMGTIEHFLKFPSLNLTTEADLIKYLETWVMIKVFFERISLEDSTTYFNSLKRHIRFLTLSSEDFVLTVAGFSILTEKEKLAIAYNLLKPGSQPMPETLSSEHEYRKFTNFLESTPSSPRKPAIQQHTCTITVPIDNCTTSINDLYILPPVICSKFTFKITHHASKNRICIYIIPLKIDEDFCRGGSSIWRVRLRSKLRLVAENKDDDLTFVSDSCVGVNWGLEQQTIIVIASIPKDKLKNGCFLRGSENKVTIEGFFTITVNNT